MSYRAALAGLLCLTILAAPACRDSRQAGVARIAILSFENLSSDAGAAWVGRALSGIIVGQLAGARDLLPFEASAARDAYARQATHTLEGYFTGGAGNWRVHAALRDQRTQKAEKTFEFTGNLITVADAVARRLAPEAKPFGTVNERSLEAYFSAAGSTDPAEMDRLLATALEADPAFGLAHVARVQTLVALGRKDEAVAAAEAAALHAGSFPPIQRARLEFLRASLAGDRKRQTAAMRDLAGVAPADLEVWRTYAELELINKNFAGAVTAYKKVVELEPGNGSYWNALGYAHAYASNLQEAVRSIEEYRSRAPEDPNPLDSLGEVHYLSGAFAEAERYFLAAHARNSAQFGGGELYRAAMARLLLGDLTTADSHFARYIEFRESLGDQLIPVRRAIWKYATGRGAAAQTDLNGVPAGEAGSLSKTQQAIWALTRADAARARQLALEGAQMTQAPGARSLAIVTGWVSGAINAPPPSPQALGYRLLLSGRFAEAADVWRRIYDATSANQSGDEAIMLAWALIESGKVAEAAPLLRLHLLPGPAPEPGFSTLLFPRYLDLKARVLKQAGNQKDSQVFYSLFTKYSNSP